MNFHWCPFCGKETKMAYDVGYDVSVEGEEHQHVEYCTCGAGRDVTDFVLFKGKTQRLFGSWKEKFGPIYF